MSDAIEKVPAANYALTRFNAVRHGALSKQTILPGEDRSEYQALHEALAAEHAPQGPTEEHLVEELATTMWRKRRLRLAEAATYRKGLEAVLDANTAPRTSLAHLGITNPSGRAIDAILVTPEETQSEIEDLDQLATEIKRALELCDGVQDDSEQALQALPEEIRAWFEREAKGDGLLTLAAFLEGRALPWLASRCLELVNRPLVREQALGEAMDIEQLEKLARYETHLDRKMERTLAMLIRLQERRRTPQIN